ncbi:MAG: hypothetical protein JEY94_17985 [Melioribacteraceae bacterium]|nr:hypothetical protein [Melioribacteraceae bacterium]
MKIILLVGLIFSSVLFLSARETEILKSNKGFIVKVKTETLKYNDIKKGKFTLREYFEYNEINNSDFNVPQSVIYIALPKSSKPVFRVINLKKESLNNVYLGKSNKVGQVELNSENILSMDEIPTNIIELKGYSFIKDNYCAVIKINPIINKSNSLFNVSEFDIEVIFDKNYVIKKEKNDKDRVSADYSNVFYNNDIAQSFKSRTGAVVKSKSDWIEWGNDYLKITVGEDGIYRISKADLINNGVSVSSINPKSFKLFSRGKENLIFVNGEEDNSFDDFDFIEFYGSKNYDSTDHRILNGVGEQAYEYLNRYSDSTVYWLTWGTEEGKRFSENMITDATDTLDYYTEIIHQETDRFLDNKETSLLAQENTEWLEKETWIYGNHNVGERSHKFDADNIVPGKVASAYYKVISLATDITNNAHKLGLKINDNESIHDSSFINKYEQKILKAEFNSDQLLEGQNNIKSISFQTDASINTVQEDWFEVEYPRYLHFSTDKMIFAFNQELSSKDYVVKIENVDSDDVLIYKIEPEIKLIRNFTVVNSILTFTDSIAQGDKYIIIKKDFVAKPEFYEVRKFTNLLQNNNQAEYILLTNRLFKNTAEKYSQFISENYSISSKVVYVDDIYNQFNYGFFAPEPIREFLKLAYDNWQEPKPKYLFIVGEANYDYKNARKIEPYVPNIVPSFGHPVSDVWFTVWDSISHVPQMMVGRLPAIKLSEFEHYYNKHEAYLNTPFDEWNKSILLFSGGKSNYDQNFTRTINNRLNDNIFTQKPIGGYVQHFYSTSNPRSNFGPFDNTFVDSVINNGAVITSFVGHSGTKIWDNGIEEVNQLKAGNNKKSFITDFGCSTGKFGEPDIVSFSEAFTNGLEGDAIGYVGNSSLGFSSTSSLFPSMFYEELIRSEFSNVGEAHLNAKIRLITQYGLSDVNKVFLYCNNLFADPVISLSIPKKINLNIKNSDIELDKIIDDNQDSTNIFVKYRNLGLVDTSNLVIRITDIFNKEVIFEKIILKDLPFNEDSFSLNIPVKNLSGLHDISISLDYENKIDEINEEDNSINFSFNVITSRIRNLISENELLIGNGKFNLLNSLNKSVSNSLIVQIDSTSEFKNPTENYFELDTLFTSVYFSNLIEGQRYWIRFKLNTPESVFLETYSFLFDPAKNIDIGISDLHSFSIQKTENLVWSEDGISVGDIPIKIELASTGFEDGGIATIKIDGTDYPNNPRGCGFHNVVINKETFEMEEYTWFNFWAPVDNYDEYYSFLSRVPNDKFLAISISGSCGGYNLPDSVITLLESFGSLEAQNIKWATAWILFGEKGAEIGSVPEEISFSEKVEYDTTFVIRAKSGNILTKKIEYIEKINSIEFDVNLPVGTQLSKYVILNRKSNIDTLGIESPEGFSFETPSDLSSIQFAVNFEGNENLEFPTLNNMILHSDLFPELATNYQVVSLEKDTLQQGENAELEFWVYNVGESPADSFDVKVEVQSPDNTKDKIFEQMVASIDSMGRKKFQVSFPTAAINGDRTFLISIDPENKIRELYEDNNYYSIPFFVKGDTTKPSLNVTFDGQDIFDGDYIAINPNIKIELSDPSLIPITDTTGVDIYLNNKRISYSINASNLTYTFNQANPKFVAEYRPELEDGEYELKVLAKDASGNEADSSGYIKKFTVSSEAKLLYVYNYPNPFSEETYFTFKLTQIPEEIEIKIYTVAGRLVKIIKMDAAELSYDFNKIYWDGKDEDGDELANGVYLYKTIMKTADKTESTVQKLAIVR